MKKLIQVALAVSLTACSQPPDFTKEVIIVPKVTDMSGATYKLGSTKGTRGTGFGPVLFKADKDFAEVGDTIVFKDGVLKVSSK